MKSLVMAVALLSLPSLCSADEIPVRVTSLLDSDNFQVIGVSREASFFNSAFGLRATDEDALTIHPLPRYSRTISFHDEDSFGANDRRSIILLRHMSRPLPWHHPLSRISGDDSDPEVAGNSIAAVPEPGTLALFATGLTFLGGALRRRLSHR